MNLALIGCFSYPLPQGSQVYFADQARGLRNAGTGVMLFTYGRGVELPAADAHGLPSARIARWLSPRRLGSGPSLGKPLADAALAAVLLREHRQRRFDAVLAHNAEAALAALTVRHWLRCPIVYVAHTLWRHELASYAAPRAASSLAAALTRFGAGVDALLARRVDAVISVAQAAVRALEPLASGPVTCIPPALTAAPDPPASAVGAACARHGLAPGGYALYAGNLDGYQALDELAAAAARTAAPIVVATHAAGSALEPLRTLRVADASEARLLTFGAGVAVLPRRARGGFPVKLLNYLEARRAVVARGGVAEGLVHGESGWLLPDESGADDWACAIETLLADPERAARIGEGGRARLERAHDPAAAAARTIALVAALIQPRTPR